MFESLKKKFSRTSEKLEEELIEEAEAENNLQEESGSRFSFFSFGRKKKEGPEEDEDNLLPEADEPVEEDSPAEEEAEEVPEEVEEVKEEKKSRFWSRNKDDDEEVEDVPEEVEEVKEEKKSRFWSRNKDDDEASEDEDDDVEDEPEEEKKSHFWSRNKDKEDVSADGEASGGIFSFVREKTIQEKHVEDILFELEMELLQGDVAMEVATEVVENVKENLVGKKIKRSNDITEYTYYALRDAVEEIINIPGKSMTEMLEEKKAQGEPLVVMFVGINGTGKTTTIGKLANYYLKMGYTPVIAASDTFRAGAIEQVTYHADNVGVKIIKHQKGSDPAAVAYDAVEHARAQGKELVLIDTAGRMQTNTNLMDEMKKIKRVSNPDLVIFVGDAITGNDATEQARKFNEAIDIDGVILTKADADSKGGASLSIGYVIKKPIMFLGVGQGYDDIMEYDSEWMLNQLFSDDEEIAEEA
ncbi:MAG: signal recognition particle-docking protein FtsY [Methanobrevibacter thaueri]|uniref:Signal recognition particle receptor FtsY n=1 Tax=Methanobrevibacter thaueri TaxID=190975 RepID=A0A8T3V6K7_9EURY|nr:signal recognition particle-docking protein FtsY [Methanobrevibacter thaueri]MBE6502222.1 signal recognition particle-docking protein FtsY [Methanobrevibacter thaueri]